MRQVGRYVNDVEDVRLIVYRDVLYLQFVGMTRKPAEDGTLERPIGRQWLGRLDRDAKVRCQQR